MKEKKDIKVVCWLKNNQEWYYPNNGGHLDLTDYDHVELLSTSYYGDLYYAWDGDTDQEKMDGRLFRTK